MAYSTNPVGVLWNNGERGEEWMWKSEAEICALVNSNSCLRPFKRMVFFWEALRPIYSIRWGLYHAHGFRLASIQSPFLDILTCIKPRRDQLLILNNLARGACGSTDLIHSILKESKTRLLSDTQGIFGDAIERREVHSVLNNDQRRDQ